MELKTECADSLRDPIMRNQTEKECKMQFAKEFIKPELNYQKKS
jgi:hypothetical protein